MKTSQKLKVVLFESEKNPRISYATGASVGLIAGAFFTHSLGDKWMVVAIGASTLLFCLYLSYEELGNRNK